MVGHSNKVGSLGGDRVRSWNSAHPRTAADCLRLRSSEAPRGCTVSRWTEHTASRPCPDPRNCTPASAKRVTTSRESMKFPDA